MKATVLLYHDITHGGKFEISGFQSPDANIYKLSQEEFERHLAAIKKRATMPMTLVDDAPADSLMITFDDGGKSAILCTAEMLEQHGWRGHFFITTDFIGSPAFMTAADLRQLRSRGHAIGSHSCSHPPRMNLCSTTQLDREWRESIRKLEDILSEAVTMASIPGGYYGDNVVEAARQAGVKNVFTSEPVRKVKDRSGCRVLGRFSIQQGVSSQRAAALAAGEFWPHFEQRAFWEMKKLAKKAGGSAWLEIRRRILARRAR
jgi:peptidoglycan/xylan/chitin deacetylase (PgdA/CDA1 family)